ncbi:unnamed protein product [Symbiodinium pilosum]|uniref:Uncharacterized protein n=1 Tax=Symbiodinium pilosum TaxID=2952 RepID=A0A812K525_SYMPI|nr:unnamed protein product [Symbiodinium pilosum]
MQPSLIPARPWKYNSAVTEYFVELEETSKIKRSDLDKYLHDSSGQEMALDPGVASGFTGDLKLELQGSGETPKADAETAKVLDEVKYYTNAIEAKINSISKMQCNLRLPYNPKPDSSSTELDNELDGILAQLNVAYGSLASILTKLDMQRLDDSGLNSLKLEFAKIREDVAKP